MLICLSLSLCLSLLPKQQNTPSLFFNKEMELSLVGLQNAGKTSLVGVLATGAFLEVRLFSLSLSRENLFRRANRKKKKTPLKT